MYVKEATSFADEQFSCQMPQIEPQMNHECGPEARSDNLNKTNVAKTGTIRLPFLRVGSRSNLTHREVSGVPSDTCEVEDLDSHAVQLAKAGRAEAWSKLYQRNFDRIFRHLSYLTGDVHVAEDLVQEVFSQALLCLGKFDERSKFQTWLFGIANNVVRKYWRSGARRANAHLRYKQQPTSSASDQNPEGVQLQQERAEALQLAIEQLSSNLREAFVLIDLCELQPHEAALQLGISANNVAVRASRARNKIRVYLAKNGWISNQGGGSE